MDTEVQDNNSWLSKRTLGLAVWLEAPAIVLFFYLINYGAALLFNEQGVDETIIKNIQISIIGFGILLASSYIWLVSNNTSRQIYTILARLYVLINISMFITALIIGIII